MNNTRLDPKTLNPDDWKPWIKESFAMIKRLGPFWLIGLPVLLGAFCLGLGQLTQQYPLASLLTLLLTLPVGAFIMTLQYHALARTRRGEAPAPWLDIANTVSDIVGHSAWFKRTVVVAIIRTMSIILFLGLVFFLLSLGASEAAAESPTRAQSPYSLSLTVLYQSTIYIWAMRPGGFMSMSYFLRVRENVDPEMANALEKLGRNRNFHLMSTCSFVMMGFGIAGMFASTIVPYVGFFIMLLVTWMKAGLNLCAWHAIFNPDGGLAEKQKVRVMKLSTVGV